MYSYTNLKGTTMKNGTIRVKKFDVLTILVMLLCFALQCEFAAVRVDRIFSSSFMIGALIVFAYMVKRKSIVFPKELNLCILWLLWMVFTALFIAPEIVGHAPRLKRIAYEAAYFISLMFFLSVGYSIHQLKKTEVFVRGMGYFALIVASIAFFVKVFHFNSLRETAMYLSGERFGGLIGNPNDYMPMALCGFAYWIQTTKETPIMKGTAIFLIVFSFLEAGSKSALVVIIAYVGVCLIEKALSSLTVVQRRNVGFIIGIGMLLVPVLFVVTFVSKGTLYAMAAGNPAITRILDFVFDFNNNIAYGNGSDRIQCWIGAAMQIQRSPFLGVGVGSSKQILEYLGYELAELTPHNIYLELLAQSGIPLFLFICVKVAKALKGSLLYKNEMIRIERHMIYTMLLLGIFFASDWHIGVWVVLGCYFANLRGIKKQATVQC